jgi:hypothetical protein
MNTDSKILSKILAPNSTVYEKDNIPLIPGIQGWFNILKSLNVIRAY